MKKTKKKQQCKAITSRGRRCVYDASFKGYCMQHFPKPKKEKKVYTNGLGTKWDGAGNIVKHCNKCQRQMPHICCGFGNVGGLTGNARYECVRCRSVNKSINH